MFEYKVRLTETLTLTFESPDSVEQCQKNLRLYLALFLSSNYGDARAAIASGADANAEYLSMNGETVWRCSLLSFSAAMDTDEQVNFLLQQEGIDVNRVIVDRDGKSSTALVTAVHLEQVSALNALLHHSDIDPDIYTSTTISHRFTALQIAVISDNLEITESLIKGGSDVTLNVKPYGGKGRKLINYVKSKHMLELLMKKHKFNLNVITRGYNALHMHAFFGNLAVVEGLIEYGANPHLLTSSG